MADSMRKLDLKPSCEMCIQTFVIARFTELLIKEIQKELMKTNLFYAIEINDYHRKKLRDLINLTFR